MPRHERRAGGGKFARAEATEQRELTADERLADDLARFYADPLGHVMYSYPWDAEPSIQVVKLPEKYRARFNCEWGPDLWACEFLDQLGEEVLRRRFDGVKPVTPIRFATVSGHEIGKSALVAWIIKWIMDTREDAKGTVTAVTDDQLRTKTWAELGKWHHMSPTRDWFTYNASRGNMNLVRARAEKEGIWRVDARTSRRGRSESFQGQHSPTSTSFFIFDEASGIEEEKVFDVREGGLSSGEPMVFDFGNGTRNSGPFYDLCTGRRRPETIVRSIDSRDVSITNKDKIAEDVAEFGEDSDYVRVRWRGLFPAASSAQFIPTDAVEAAGRRPIPFRTGTEPVVVGVDVARGGDDSVVWPRVGDDARSFPPKTYRGRDTVPLMGLITSYVRELSVLGLHVSMICVDEGGVGGPIIDQLRHLGYPVTGVPFGSTKVRDPRVYKYVVDEIWGRMRDGLAGRLCVPGREDELGRELYEQLISREFGLTRAGGLIRLEEKVAMRERGLRSPDHADALACTYFIDPPPKGLDRGMALGVPSQVAGWDYDPHPAGRVT